MRRSSKQLIADLVAGRSDNPTEAMETIVRSPRLRAAYEQQVAARDALAALEPVAMTEPERADLRREVWTSLTATPAAKIAAPGWGWRTAGAAAALAVVIGGAALLTQSLGADGAGDGDAVFAADVTTTGAASESLAGEDSRDDGELAPQAVETEDLLRRYAEIVRTTERPELSLTEADLRCSDVDDLEGQLPVATFDVDGVEYQAWVPAEAADDVDKNTPITFVDVDSCTVQPVIR